MDREVWFGRARFACPFILVASLFGSGCATPYVDGALRNVSAEQIRRPSRPQDVQLLFTFRTKGTDNIKVTDALKSEVEAAVASSHLFVTQSGAPALSGAILNVVIDNVPLDDSAFAKGFATGLTLGLAGNVVTDGYICTVDFVSPQGKKVTKTIRHAIHTTIGAKGAPANGVKAKSLEEAAHTMTRQVVTAALKDLAEDPVFK